MLAALLALAGCAGDKLERAQTKPQALGLFTSLPILWPETDDLRGLLRSDTQPHWALDVLREAGAVRPLDSLAADGVAVPLLTVRLLVMAQPRALSPQENVALDRWVRGGGHVLLFADPMLTEESHFGLGDKRRPQDVALLSPILMRWGLVLEFDEDQRAGEQWLDWPSGGALPVNLSGRFSLLGKTKRCRLLAQGLGAHCSVGKGRVLALADAALLEQVSGEAIADAQTLSGQQQAKRSMLGRLLTEVQSNSK